jgi:hypothetical protein
MVDGASEEPRKEKHPKAKKVAAPATPRDWDSRLFKGPGERSPHPLYEAVGLALSKWNSFEEEMSGIFCAMVADRAHFFPARRAFGAIRTFEGRSDMLRLVAEIYFTAYERPEISRLAPVTDLRAELKNLIKEWKDYNSRRNEIAHGVVKSFPNYETKFNKNPPLVTNEFVHFLYWWGPAHFDSSKTSPLGVPTFAYNSADLKHYAEKFNNLRGPARAFGAKIRGLPSPFE